MNSKSFINHYKHYTQMRSLNISRSVDDDDDYEFTQLRNRVKPICELTDFSVIFSLMS